MKKIGLLLICILVLVGCQNTSESEEKLVCDIDCSIADMSDYEGFNNPDGVFLDTSFETMIDKLENKDTFVLYLGFAECPWCLEALPVLNEEALTANISIYYVNVREEDEDLRTEENKYYVALQGYVEEYLDEDDDKIYVPAVIIVNNGEVVAYHVGTTDEHDAKEREMYDEEIEELHEIYQSMIALITSSEED